MTPVPMDGCAGLRVLGNSSLESEQFVYVLIKLFRPMMMVMIFPAELLGARGSFFYFLEVQPFSSFSATAEVAVWLLT